MVDGHHQLFPPFQVKAKMVEALQQEAKQNVSGAVVRQTTAIAGAMSLPRTLRLPMRKLSL
jgi:hypothetical protein